MLASENSAFDDMDAYRDRYDADDLEDEDDDFDEEEDNFDGEESDIYGSSGSAIFLNQESSSFEGAAKTSQFLAKMVCRGFLFLLDIWNHRILLIYFQKKSEFSRNRKLGPRTKSLEETHDSITPTRDSVHQKELALENKAKESATSNSDVNQQLFAINSEGK